MCQFPMPATQRQVAGRRFNGGSEYSRPADPESTQFCAMRRAHGRHVLQEVWVPVVAGMTGGGGDIIEKN